MTWLYVPVRMAARLGAQIELVQKQLSNLIPPAARRSRCGVRFTRLPYALIAWAAWSSDITNTMFGRCGIPQSLVTRHESLRSGRALVASVHGQRSPEVDLPRVLHAWAAAADSSPSAADAMEWLKEEHPGLLRAWLLSRVEQLLDAELANG